MPNVSRTLTSHTLQTSRYYRGIFSESNKKEEDVSNLRFFQIKKKSHYLAPQKQEYLSWYYNPTNKKILIVNMVLVKAVMEADTTSFFLSKPFEESG